MDLQTQTRIYLCVLNYLQEKGKCRAWNETRCPYGLVQVNYKDPNRINYTLIRSNVKVIDPNTTLIYSCPVLLPGQDEATSVFVAPNGLEINVGDVLSSAQAGGIMHKVNDTTSTGKVGVGNWSPESDRCLGAFTTKVDCCPLNS